MNNQRAKKQLRNSRACDYCNKRGIRCRPSDENSQSCQNCVDFDIACTYNRPLKRGRARAQLPQEPLDQQHAPERYQPLNLGASEPAENHNETIGPATKLRPEPSWAAFAVASQATIVSMLDVYFKLVYPIFPFFDRDEILAKIEEGAHLTNRNLFASVMAACALAAGRVQDGGLPSSNGSRNANLAIRSHTFFTAAEQSLPLDIISVDGFDAMRTYPLLAIAGIQDGRIDVMHKYIGMYFAIMSIRKWHDESNWPSSMTIAEREQMRRVYWSTYTLDVYSSIVWNGCVHFQEAHSKVLYPSQDLPGSYYDPDTTYEADTPCWMTGWNFTTNLYRVLEHAISRFRTQSSQFNVLEIAAPSSPTFSAGLNNQINRLYAELPDDFKRIEPMSGNLARDIYSFQAANIQATLALLRMLLFSVESTHSVDKKCDVARDLLNTFHRIPGAYLRAISRPLIYHIFGIGNILGSVINAPLSETSYATVRELLLSLASLLESMEAVLQSDAGTGKSLLQQVERIDQFMASQRSFETSLAGGDAVAAGDWGVPVNGISPQYQLPEDLLLEWTWPSHFPDDSLLYYQG